MSDTEQIRPDYYKIKIVKRVPREKIAPAGDGFGGGMFSSAEAFDVEIEIQPFDVLDALGLDRDFYVATALTYLWRLGRKTAERASDLAKAATYVAQALERARRDEAAR